MLLSRPARYPLVIHKKMRESRISCPITDSSCRGAARCVRLKSGPQISAGRGAAMRTVTAVKVSEAQFLRVQRSA